MAEPVLRWPPHRFERWTEADLGAMPNDGNKYEIINGRLIVTPPPTTRHQGRMFAIARALHAVAPPEWLIRPGIGVRLLHGKVEPDIAVLQPGAPDDEVWNDAQHVALVVEIASPSTKDYDVGDKATAYACAGIPWYWRVAPGSDGASYVYGLSGIGEYSLHARVAMGESFTLNEPFPITIPASEWLEPER
jgi:Uma2 family endonuclease